MSNLPTEPGPYWWREKDGDDWVFIYVELIGADLFARSKGAHNNLCAYVDQWKRFYPVGQWQRCIHPDDGQECFSVRAPSGQFVATGTQQCCESRKDYLNEESDLFWDGQEYDVVPVMIVRRQQ